MCHALLEVEKKKMRYLKEKRSAQKAEEDDDMNFFKSLMPHVKTFSSYNKMEYCMKIIKVTPDFLKSTTNSIEDY